jgi:hypothetical protein
MSSDPTEVVAPVPAGEPAAPRTRRALLAAGAAAAAATVVGAIRPLPVSAAVDDNADMYVGIQYGDVSWTTGLVNQTNSSTVFYATSTHSGIALQGTATNGRGVQGSSTGGWGVYATSFSNVALVAESTSSNGVYATSGAIDRAAVAGWAKSTSTGVQGYAGGSIPDGRANTGVMGTAAGSGTGGYFASDSGNALHVAGKAKFSRSGIATIGATRTYVDVTVPGGLSSGSAVVATLQIKRGTATVVAARVNYPSAGKARIYLNKVASKTAGTKVAWFVVD